MGGETLGHGNLHHEVQGVDNLAVDPSEDESLYLAMGNVKQTTQSATVAAIASVTSKSSTYVQDEPEETYIDGYIVEDNPHQAVGTSPRPKTRKAKPPKPSPAARSIQPPPKPKQRQFTKTGLVSALKTGFTFRRKKEANTHALPDFDMDNLKHDYQHYKKGKPNVYEGLTFNQDTDNESDTNEGAYDLAGVLRVKAAPSPLPPARVIDNPDQYYSPVAKDDPVAKDPPPQKSNKVEGENDLVGALNAKVTDVKVGASESNEDTPRRESEIYADAQLYGDPGMSSGQKDVQSSKKVALLYGNSSSVAGEDTYDLATPGGDNINVAMGKSNTIDRAPTTGEPEGEVYAEAKMYGMVGQPASRNEVRRSLEIPYAVDVEGGGFGKQVVRAMSQEERQKREAAIEEDEMYQEAMMHTETVNSVTMGNVKASSAVITDNPDADDLGRGYPQEEEESIYAEATFHAGMSSGGDGPRMPDVKPSKKNGEEEESIYAEATFHGAISSGGDVPRMPVAMPSKRDGKGQVEVGKKTATLVRNDVDLSEFAEPGDEDDGDGTPLTVTTQPQALLISQRLRRRVSMQRRPSIGIQMKGLECHRGQIQG